MLEPELFSAAAWPRILPRRYYNLELSTSDLTDNFNNMLLTGSK